LRGLGKPGRLRVDQPTITAELGPAPNAYTPLFDCDDCSFVESVQAGALLMKVGLFFCSLMPPASESAPNRRTVSCAAAEGGAQATRPSYPPRQRLRRRAEIRDRTANPTTNPIRKELGRPTLRSIAGLTVSNDVISALILSIYTSIKLATDASQQAGLNVPFLSTHRTELPVAAQMFPLPRRHRRLTSC
jgi:hypothetical protein